MLKKIGRVWREDKNECAVVPPRVSEWSHRASLAVGSRGGVLLHVGPETVSVHNPFNTEGR